MDEFELIHRFFSHRAPGGGVVLGVGDDGAVLAPEPGKQQIQVVDTLVEGVHFPKDFSPADIGYRAVAVNLSDVAAMGAVPRWMTLALSLSAADESWLEAFAEGVYAAAAEHDVRLVGGDTTQANQIVVTVHMTGDVGDGNAIRRDGAEPGDTIWVTGTLGDAAGGLEGLRTGRLDRELVSRYARPSARVRYGQKLVGVASAAIDISDGLLDDLGKLLDASRVGADIDVERLPISSALSANFDADRCRRFALSGGDDYELCFTTADDVAPDGGVMDVTAIGTVTEVRGLTARLDGEIVEVGESGYRHFA